MSVCTIDPHGRRRTLSTALAAMTGIAIAMLSPAAAAQAPYKYTTWTFTWYCGSQWCSVNKVSGASAANYNGLTWVWFI